MHVLASPSPAIAIGGPFGVHLTSERPYPIERPCVPLRCRYEDASQAGMGVAAEIERLVNHGCDHHECALCGAACTTWEELVPFTEEELSRLQTAVGWMLNWAPCTIKMEKVAAVETANRLWRVLEIRMAPSTAGDSSDAGGGGEQARRPVVVSARPSGR